MKRWLLVLSALTLLGVPGTLFVANVLDVSNEVHITATVEDPNAIPEEEPNSVVPTSTSGGGGGGGNGSNSNSQSAAGEEETDEESQPDSTPDSSVPTDSSIADEQGDQASQNSTEEADEVEEEERAIIYFGGYAFPNATIQFSLDGGVVLTAVADDTGYFEGNYSGLALGDHVFSFQAKDYKGDESRLVSYSYTVQSASPLYASSILLPPIFAPGNNGDALNGVAIPGAQIEVYGVTQSGQELVLLQTIDVPSDGSYKYEVDLKSEGYDQYYVACSFKGNSCGFSGVVPVQNVSANFEVPGNVFADFTNDVEVNFVDFSFMRAAFLSEVSILFYDLDEDGELTLKDFSLLNYQWTQ